VHGVDAAVAVFVEVQEFGKRNNNNLDATNSTAIG